MTSNHKSKIVFEIRPVDSGHLAWGELVEIEFMNF